ncbi:MAG: hypothetical protein C5B56_00060 [Proteobacteria bacterium]|nr:MAG: hypothetical protein C5B56_00060 [Pseudomonadota bacterium]
MTACSTRAAVEWAKAPHTPSLRAQRSNPGSFRGSSLDCYVARAPRNDGGPGGDSAISRRSRRGRLASAACARRQGEAPRNPC